MKRKLVLFTIAILLVFLSGVAVWMWTVSEQAALRSCRLSWEDSISAALNIGEMKDLKIEKDWRPLSSSEIDRVRNSVLKHGKPDCPSRLELDFGNDGKKTRIFVREANSVKEVKLSE